jgi:hypothetical protein
VLGKIKLQLSFLVSHINIHSFNKSIFCKSCADLISSIFLIISTTNVSIFLLAITSWLNSLDRFVDKVSSVKIIHFSNSKLQFSNQLKTIHNLADRSKLFFNSHLISSILNIV